jgi:hypothetical protein
VEGGGGIAELQGVDDECGTAKSGQEDDRRRQRVRTGELQGRPGKHGEKGERAAGVVEAASEPPLGLTHDRARHRAPELRGSKPAGYRRRQHGVAEAKEDLVPPAKLVRDPIA